MSGRRREPIVVERVLAATPEEVFAAWGDAEGMRAWMCPPSVKSAEAEVDFRVGGRFTILMRGAEGDYAHHGRYLEVDPPRRLVFTWVSDFMPADERETRVTVTLEAADGGTRVRLVHDELPDSDRYDGHTAGWTEIVRKLGAHLASRANRPAQPPRRSP